MTTSRTPQLPCGEHGVDAYTLPPEAIEQPPQSLGGALRQIGPGLILAGAIVGTGELIATTHLGAKVGFALLWLVIVSCFIKVFVQAELGRHTISSGKTAIAAFRTLPGPSFLIGWWWVIMMLTTQLQLAAMVGGVGQACHVALPGVSDAIGSVLPAVARQPVLPWSILAVAATSLLLGTGGYRLVEKGTTALVVLFTFTTIGCVVLLPAVGHPIALGDVLAGLKFQLPNVDGALAAALAMFGITGVGATELVHYPYWCIEKGYARRTGPYDGSAEWVARAQGWVRVMRLDVWVSLAVYTVATLAFYVLGAAVLHGRDPAGLPGNVAGMLMALSHMYAPVLGEFGAKWFIVVGVFAVLYSTLYAATAANTRGLVDFLHVNCGLPFRFPGDRARWVRLLCMVFPVIDLGLYLAIRNPVKMVLIGGFMQAMTLPMIAASAVYLRYRRTHPAIAPGRVWDGFLWLSMTGLFVAAVYGMWDSVMKLMK